MWNKIRLTGYVAGALGIAATIAAAMGFGTYDPATGLYDLPPINVMDLAGLVVAGGANLVAAVALIRKWGR